MLVRMIRKGFACWIGPELAELIEALARKRRGKGSLQSKAQRIVREMVSAGLEIPVPPDRGRGRPLVPLDYEAKKARAE